MIGESAVEEELDEGTELCNCEFTLAYGTKILLRNTKLRLLLGTLCWSRSEERRIA